MKSFFIVRDTQRGSHSYTGMKSGRREIEVTRSRREVIKTGENQLASSHFLHALHSLDPSELFTELHREEKRED